jgi:hypothetical protein
MLDYLAARGFDRVAQAMVTEESVRFALPAAVRAVRTERTAATTTN